jgi:hypothetical protein
VARRLLPSTGSRGSVPPLQRYYSTLRLPSTPPAAFRCLHLAVPRLHPCFAPGVAGCGDDGPGVGHPVPPTGTDRGGEGASQVPGGPPRSCPALRPRRDRTRQAIAAPRRGLPSLSQRRLPRFQRFRGSITRPVRSLSTLRSPGRPGTTQDSLPAAGQLCRTGLVTRKVPTKGFRCRFPLSQAFLAHKKFVDLFCLLSVISVVSVVECPVFTSTQRGRQENERVLYPRFDRVQDRRLIVSSSEIRAVPSPRPAW